MINEVLQWVALTILTFLLLGVFRQLGQLAPPRHPEVAVGPARGSMLPEPVRDAVVSLTEVDGVRRVAFVTEACLGCQRLLSNLEMASERTKSSILLVAEAGSSAYSDALAALGVPFVLDNEGAISLACDATVTPFIISVDSGEKVIAKEVTSSV